MHLRQARLMVVSACLPALITRSFRGVLPQTWQHTYQHEAAKSPAQALPQ
jgi:hypothetical protein